MANLAWASLLLILGFRLVLSAEYSKEHFLVPDGTKDDFSETYYNGDTLNVRWAGWDSWWTDQYMDGVTRANLYVGAWNSGAYPYNRILTSSIDISSSGTYSWKIDISDEALSNTRKYALYFISVKDVYGPNAHQFWSVGFLIQNSTTSSSAGATTTSPTTTSTATTSSTTSSSRGTTSTSPKATTSSALGSSGGLDTGAKAGIGVGVGLGGIAVLAGLAYWFVRRLRKPSSQGMTESSEVYHPAPAGHPEHHGYYQDPKPHAQEAFTAPAELPSSLERR